MYLGLTTKILCGLTQKFTIRASGVSKYRSIYQFLKLLLLALGFKCTRDKQVFKMKNKERKKKKKKFFHHMLHSLQEGLTYKLSGEYRYL